MRLHHIRRARGRFLLPALALACGLLWARAAHAETTSTGLTCTWVGTTGNDTYAGTSGDDVICGLGGADTLSGGSGNDVIDGGAGNDTLSGGAGSDLLLGGTGNDIFNGGTELDTVSYADHTTSVTADIDGKADDGSSGEKDNVATDVENLSGSSASDTLTGSAVDNTLSGGAGNDTLTAGGGNDTLTGDAGADTMTGGTGTDTVSYASSICNVTANLDGTANDGCTNEKDKISTDTENLTGGSGNDTLTGSSATNALSGGGGSDTLSGGAGNDTLNGGAGTDTLNGDAGADTLNGGTEADTLSGGTENDILNGDAGNDTLSGGGGADTLTGGTDTDTATYATQTCNLTLTLDGVANDGCAAEGDNIQASTENLTGGSGNDTVTGGSGTNTLSGGAGADTLNGGAGTDTLNGDAGADTLNGGTEADTLSGGTENDILNGDAGNDTLSGDAGNDALSGGTENDILNGDGGNDTLSGDSGADTLNGGTEGDTLNGGDGSDTLNGGAGSDTLNGGAGADTLEGGSEADLLNGGTESDNLSGGPGADLLNGGDGTDTVSYADQGCDLIVTLDDASGDGCSGESDNVQTSVENLVGGTGDDTLIGDGDANVVSGGAGGDLLDGGAGDDTLTGDAGEDEVLGGDGADLVSGGNGSDVLEGEGGLDACQGDGLDELGRSCEQAIDFELGVARRWFFSVMREDHKLVPPEGSFTLIDEATGEYIHMFSDPALGNSPRASREVSAWVKSGSSLSFSIRMSGDPVSEMADLAISGSLGVVTGDRVINVVLPATNAMVFKVVDYEGRPVPDARVDVGHAYSLEDYAQHFPCPNAPVTQASAVTCDVGGLYVAYTGPGGLATFWLPQAPVDFLLSVAGAYDSQGVSGYFVREYPVDASQHEITPGDIGMVRIRGSLERVDGIAIVDLGPGRLVGGYGIYTGAARGYREPPGTFSAATRSYDISVPSGESYHIDFGAEISGIAGLGSGTFSARAELSSLEEDVTIDVRLPWGYPVVVQAQDADGEPVAGALLSMRSFTRPDCSILSTAQTHCDWFGTQVTVTDESGFGLLWSANTDPGRASAVKAEFSLEGIAYATGYVEFTVLDGTVTAGITSADPGSSLVIVRYCGSTDYWNKC